MFIKAFYGVSEAIKSDMITHKGIFQIPKSKEISSTGNLHVLMNFRNVNFSFILNYIHTPFFYLDHLS